MAGLLDFLSQDPNEQRALVQGLLSGAFGAMNGRGSKLQAWGQGGLAGLSGYGNELERQTQEKLRNAQTQHGLMQNKLLQVQIDEQKRKLADAQAQDAWLANLQSPQQMAVTQALSGGGGPTAANAEKIKVDPYQQLMFDAVKNRALPVQSYISATQKDTSPLTVKEGESLLDRKTLKPIFRNQKEDDFIRNMRAAGIPEGSPQWNQLLMQKAQKDATHAPPVQVNVPVSTEKTLWGGLADTISGDFKTKQQSAQAGVDTIKSLDELRNVYGRGITAGTGADLRLEATKALNALGANIDPAKVADTEYFRTVSKDMLLGKIKALGANPSNADVRFMEQTLPTIDRDPQAIPKIIDYLDKRARGSIREYNSLAEKIKASPNAKAIPWDISVPEPSAPARMPTPADIAAEAARRAAMRK